MSITLKRNDDYVIVIVVLRPITFQSPDGFFVFFATQVAMRVVDVNQGGPRSKMGR